jgi:hypothetical protein
MTDDRFERITIVVMCSGAAAFLVAATLGYIAHYDFGLSRQEIRIPAVTGAAIIALLVATEYFGKKLRKPK